jgi:hypothetical protein
MEQSPFSEYRILFITFFATAFHLILMPVDPCHHSMAHTKVVDVGMAKRYGGWLRIY